MLATNNPYYVPALRSKPITPPIVGVQADILHASDDRVVVMANNGTTSGRVTMISDTGAIVTLDLGWQYFDMGDIDEVSPPYGQVNTKITISGTNLQGGSDKILTASLGSKLAAIDSQTNTEVVLISPASTASSQKAVGASLFATISARPWKVADDEASGPEVF